MFPCPFGCACGDFDGECCLSFTVGSGAPGMATDWCAVAAGAPLSDAAASGPFADPFVEVVGSVNSPAGLPPWVCAFFVAPLPEPFALLPLV